VFAETGVITRDTALAAIRQENSDGRRWASVEFDDVRCVSATPDATMLAYRARARWEHETTQISVLASSLYVNRDGAWRLVFHQQTPSPGGSHAVGRARIQDRPGGSPLRDCSVAKGPRTRI